MPTINDVAQASGVSISTVSYALSGKRPVSAETRRRVEEAVLQLNYRANAGARMLAGRRTHIFALTEPFRADTHAPTHMAFVLATAIAARRHDYDILLLTDEQARAGMRRVAASDLADGILVLDVAPHDERVELARALSVPTVFIGIPIDNEGLVCVDLDFEAAAILAVDRLALAGHRSVALIGHPVVAYENSNYPPRVRDGFLGAAERHGLAAEFRVSGEERTESSTVRRAVAELLDAGVTGLVLHCVEEAHAAVLAEIESRGLAVPADVSVVSVGSAFDTAQFLTPIDSVPLVPSRSCDVAVELAIRWVEDGHASPGVHLIEPTYLSNDSVAPPPTLTAGG